MKALRSFLKSWMYGTDGVAAIEAGLIFPIMAVMMLGTFDLGNGILSNQKTIRAAQVVGDLVTRETTIDAAGLDEAVQGGMLSLEPFDTTTYGVDIVSVSFDSKKTPTIVWRETRNMTAVPNILNTVTSLEEPNSGVVIVTVQYKFQPVFANFILGDVEMQEQSFTRGRKSPVVNKV
jgi:Flp pilus assembly protein TadG